jgi:hypothetical protein
MVYLIVIAVCLAVIYGCSMNPSRVRPRSHREELEQAVGRMSRLSIGY